MIQNEIPGKECAITYLIIVMHALRYLINYLAIFNFFVVIFHKYVVHFKVENYCTTMYLCKYVMIFVT